MWFMCYYRKIAKNASKYAKKTPHIDHTDYVLFVFFLYYNTKNHSFSHLCQVKRKSSY